MKSPALYFVRFFILFLLLNHIQAQEWEWSNPWPQGNSLLSVHFINNDTGFAVGYNGTILGTTNAGASWSVTYHSSQVKLNSVHFLDEKLILAAGQNGLTLRSTNMGDTWEELSLPSSPTIRKVQVVNDTLAYMAGHAADGVVFRSVNAGQNWDLVSITDGLIVDIVAIGTDTVFALGTYGIYRSLDGGSSWHDTTSGEGYSLNSLSFTNNLHGVASGGKSGYDYYVPRILITVDGGENWTAPYTYIPQAIYHKVNLASDMIGYAVGKIEKDYIIKTNDGGYTWEYIGASDLSISDFCFTGENVGYSVGLNGPIQMTTDGALTWQSVSRQVEDNFHDIYFISPGQGFACGDNTISWTSDNGDEWQKTQFLVYPGSDLTSIDFSSPTDGFASGDNCMYYTRDGGTTWTWQHAGSWRKYNCLDIPPGSDSGYMVGREGSIVRFNLDLKDLFWQFQPTGLFETELFSVHFPVMDTGYVAAEDGIILRTTNGGAYWEPTECGIPVDLHSVFFINTKTGWAAGNNGTILKTIDGGDSWTQQASGTGQTLNAVKFLDASFGYAVGNACMILRTIDGGENWVREWAPGTNDLFGLYIWDTSNVYACGKNNTILKSSVGGWIGFRETNTLPSGSMRIFPNPLHQVASVGFELYEPGRTEILLYDLHGRKVMVLVEEAMPAGNHNILLDRSNLPPGVYLVKLKSGRQTAVSRIIIQ